MTESSTDIRPHPNNSAAVEQFRIDVPQEPIDDLHARLANIPSPDELPGVG